MKNMDLTNQSISKKSSSSIYLENESPNSKEEEFLDYIINQLGKMVEELKQKEVS